MWDSRHALNRIVYQTLWNTLQHNDDWPSTKVYFWIAFRPMQRHRYRVSSLFTCHDESWILASAWMTQPFNRFIDDNESVDDFFSVFSVHSSDPPSPRSSLNHLSAALKLIVTITIFHLSMINLHARDKPFQPVFVVGSITKRLSCDYVRLHKRMGMECSSPRCISRTFRFVNGAFQSIFMSNASALKSIWDLNHVKILREMLSLARDSLSVSLIVCQSFDPQTSLLSIYRVIT